MRSSFLLALWLIGYSICFANNFSVITNKSKKSYSTQRATSEIIIDGLIKDPAWNAVDWGGDFIQFQPKEGNDPSNQTQFKILYDDNNLYVAYRCYDNHPDSIVNRMARKDFFPGDWISIMLDCYHDKRTAFSFTLSVSGVRNDEFISNNGNFDDTWNPIWMGKTNIDSLGWTGEIQIPFSQLRFNATEDKIWGLQVMRKNFRYEERSIWQYISQNAGGWVSEFGELNGLKNIKPRKQVEIAPYMVASTDLYQKDGTNPFATGHNNKVKLGVDGKVAVTNDLILDFTINPDFGQVEADPSQVRIDGFQNYFNEKRPFFIESNNIFSYQLTGSEAGGDYDADQLFYSRRIGSSPHGYPNLNVNEYASVPGNTSILGAAKFSGKTQDGWSIGFIESVTNSVNATVDNERVRRKELIEPLTNYAVARLQKDWDHGNTVIGGILTSVNRQSNLNNTLHDAAYTGGIDFFRQWNNRKWYVRGNLIFSSVLGSKEKIYGTQTAFEHLFQRLNATEVKVDADRTSLNGTASTFRFGKSGGDNNKNSVLRFETGITHRSPELELNDIGFMLTANEINHFTWAGIQWPKQHGIFRRFRINYNHWLKWDFGGQLLNAAINSNSHATFTNNWQIGGGLTYNLVDISNTALRGGSSLRLPSNFNQFGYIQSDNRKKVGLGIFTNNNWGLEAANARHNVNFNVGIQPSNAFNINGNVGYSYNYRKQDQYVAEVNFENSKRVIVSQVVQKTFSFTLRLNYNITPDFTIQYYGQPFITRPVYSNFATVTDPLNKSFTSRFHLFESNQINLQNNVYSIDENKDGKIDYSFDNPNFNFVQFRSNFVARWEYKPGSEFYLVWSQGNTPDASMDFNSPLSSSLINNAFSSRSLHNIFLLKATYRLVR